MGGAARHATGRISFEFVRPAVAGFINTHYNQTLSIFGEPSDTIWAVGSIASATPMCVDSGVLALAYPSRVAVKMWPVSVSVRSPGAARWAESRRRCASFVVRPVRCEIPCETPGAGPRGRAEYCVPGCARADDPSCDMLYGAL